MAPLSLAEDVWLRGGRRRDVLLLLNDGCGLRGVSHVVQSGTREGLMMV